MDLGLYIELHYSTK